MLNSDITKYFSYRKRIKALEYAFYMIGWDSETEAPNGVFEDRSKQVETLSEMYYEITLSDQYYDVVYNLYQNLDLIPEILQIEIRKNFKELIKSRRVPSKIMVEMSKVETMAQQAWVKAKKTSSYELFKPYLEKNINLKIQYADFARDKEESIYSFLLDSFEEDYNTTRYDDFFELIQKELVPFIKKVTAKTLEYDSRLDNLIVSVDKQKEVSKYLMTVMDFDLEHGMLKTSEHPFTSGYGSTDVRVTTHYYEDNFISNIFSIIHELGHGIYEQQCDPSFNDTMLSGGASMAMHESQSRFYENIVGRNFYFWKKHYPKIQSIIGGELQNISLDSFYKFINKSLNSLIRTEADELTYPIHVLIRYEMEKLLLSKQLTVDEAADKWSALYQKYLGVVPTNDSEGILQDMHWAGNSFGYFPTYALGSAYAAQIYYQIRKEIDFDKAVMNDNLGIINSWLKEKIHQFAASKTSDELLLLSTQQKFDPRYYIQYLIEKYTTLYNL